MADRSQAGDDSAGTLALASSLLRAGARTDALVGTFAAAPLAAAAWRAGATDCRLPDSAPRGDAAMMPAPSAERTARKEAKLLAKSAARARKRGEPAAAAVADAGAPGAAAAGHAPAGPELFKACDLCAKRQPLLYRCQIDATRAWKFTCPSCWPSVSGGVADGNRATHPHYRYGGTWKYFKR